MDAAALAISVITFIFSWRVYIKHDRLLKTQEAWINDYQIKKIREESISRTKAVIEAEVVKGLRGHRKMVVSNSGMAAGRNINVTIPPTKGLHVLGVPKNFHLIPGKSMEINMDLSYGHPDSIDIRIEWEDDSGSKNVSEQAIYL